MRTPTIYQIKRALSGTESKFFSKENMRGAHQTLKSFKVKRSPTGRVFLYAPDRADRGWVRRWDFREFADDKLLLVKEDDNSLFYAGNEAEILAFIESH